MSDSVFQSPTDHKREQRRLAIEEKRRKLAEVKEKNKSILSKVSTPSPSKALSPGHSWNEIIETIESLPSTPTSLRYVLIQPLGSFFDSIFM